MEDITDLKRSEEQLEQHAARLKDANRELEAFSYSVSHDLKAPLRSICGFSDVLLQDFGTRLDEEVRGYLQRIRLSGQRMTQLVDDLLSLSRLTIVELHREEVDLSALAHTVAEDVTTNSPGRSIKFTIAPKMRASCDARLMRIVLENLFANAAKFTSDRESARIEFGSAVEGGKCVYFARDNGAGFDMALAHDLFTPFKRLHEQSRFPGNGIGLATVRRIIHRHGGTIWAESTVGEGAKFSFTL